MQGCKPLRELLSYYVRPVSGSAVHQHVMQHNTDLFDGSTPDLLGSLLTHKVAEQGYYLTYQGVSHLPTQEGARGVSPAVEGGRGGKETESKRAASKKLEGRGCNTSLTIGVSPFSCNYTTTLSSDTYVPDGAMATANPTPSLIELCVPLLAICLRLGQFLIAGTSHAHQNIGWWAQADNVALCCPPQGLA